MTVKFENASIEVSVVRLDPDVIEEHLRSSTSVLHDILQDGIKPENEQSGHACQQCGKFYKTERSLYSHIMLKHPEDKEEVQCTVCDKKYPSLLSLRKHERYMHRYEYRCKACYRTFATPEILAGHSESCSNNVSPCRVCDKIFNSRLALRNHINYNHRSSEEISNQQRQCKVCRRIFTCTRNLLNHMAAVHPAGATDCNTCGRSFNSIVAFRSHILYKHAEQGARCLKCHKLFSSERSLCRHMNKIHGNSQPCYLCALCKSSFHNSNDLIQDAVQKNNTDVSND